MATINKIIKKGFDLICEKGYHNISTPDIAKAAGVSTGIIYQYFTDKKEIFIEGVKAFSNNIMFPLHDLIKNQNLNINNVETIVKEIINLYIKNHAISKKAHEELMAMSHLDDDVANIFKESEFEMTNKIVEILKYNNIEIENNTEEFAKKDKEDPEEEDSEDKEDNGLNYVSIPKIREAIENVDSEELSDDDFNLVVGCIEGTTKLITKKERKPRNNAKPKSKAEILNFIQNKEAMFDLEQKKVALLTIDGPQRIRGLAGSGKTIVLAMKAAQYHLSNPNAHILYTYYTKSLYKKQYYFNILVLFLINHLHLLEDHQLVYTFHQLP